MCAPIVARSRPLRLFFFFFHDPPTTDIYTLSLHDALPIFADVDQWWRIRWLSAIAADGVVLWLVLQSDPPRDSLRATTAILVTLALFAATFADSTVKIGRAHV